MCDSLDSAMAGGSGLIYRALSGCRTHLQRLTTSYMGVLNRASALAVAHAQFVSADPKPAPHTARIERAYDRPPPPDIAAYTAATGRAVPRPLILGSHKLGCLDTEIEARGLCGLQGAGFGSHCK